MHDLDVACRSPDSPSVEALEGDAMTGLRTCAALLPWLALALTGCVDSDGDVQPLAVELPPAGTSRIVALEFDTGADGDVDRIVRYTYGATGLLVSEETWNAVDGVMVGDPVQTVTRTHDAQGRVLTITTRSEAGERILTATYGADGRLAETTTRWGSGSVGPVTRYAWEAARMTQVVVESRLGGVGKLSYGADGRVARIDWDYGRGDGDAQSYAWRADGQLGSASYSESVGRLVAYVLTYDDHGRIVDWLRTDDGIDDERRRFAHDTRGRPVKVEIDSEPDMVSDYVFAADTIVHIRWQNLPCQPTYEPQVLPTLDLEVTGAASAIGATLVCSDRP